MRCNYWLVFFLLLSFAACEDASTPPGSDDYLDGYEEMGADFGDADAEDEDLDSSEMDIEWPDLELIDDGDLFEIEDSAELEELVEETTDLSEIEDIQDLGQVLYPADRLQSPLTPALAAALGALSNEGAGAPNVFMKVGASGTVSQSFLYCFADDLPWLEYPELEESWAFFRAGNGNDDGQAGPLTPYDRATYAAMIGRTAAWVMEGSPAPVEQEATAINPAFALLNYGTNDMNMGTTHLSALWGFYESYSELMDWTMGQGMVPIITGILPRNDSAEADLWVATYNAVIRGMAQSRGIPFVDLELAVRDLPNRGLSSDGLHANTAPGGPCDLSAVGLNYGYNQRNLITMQALDRARRAALLGEAADLVAEHLQGQGTVDDPYLIEALPFTHQANTEAAARLIDSYTGCGATQDESGGELYYKLSLAEAANLRFLVLDRGEDDLDLHLLSAPQPQACVQRDHRVLQGRLDAGEWWIVVDSWVNASGEVLDGVYQLVILPCDEGDPACEGDLN